jgi:NTP pyrophosphatase (non-canonical NTP hydrolase)
MPGTITPPRPVTVTPVGDPAPHADVWEHVARVVARLAAANGRGPHETATRIMKITEEAGEAVAAYLAVTGQNPRKSITATSGELAGELCDVVLAALVALVTITGGTPQAEATLASHVAARAARLSSLRAAA